MSIVHRSSINVLFVFIFIYFEYMSTVQYLPSTRIYGALIAVSYSRSYSFFSSWFRLCGKKKKNYVVYDIRIFLSTYLTYRNHENCLIKRTKTRHVEVYILYLSRKSPRTDDLNHVYKVLTWSRPAERYIVLRYALHDNKKAV